MPIVPGDVCPLNWWKEHEQLFPTLAKMARDILAISIAVVDFERVFSEERALINYHHNRLKDETIENLLISKS